MATKSRDSALKGLPVRVGVKRDHIRLFQRHATDGGPRPASEKSSSSQSPTVSGWSGLTSRAQPSALRSRVSAISALFGISCFPCASVFRLSGSLKTSHACTRLSFRKRRMTPWTYGRRSAWRCGFRRMAAPGLWTQPEL